MLTTLKSLYHSHRTFVSTISRRNWRKRYLNQKPSSQNEYCQYDQTGFKVVPGFLSSDEISSLRRALSEQPEVTNSDLFKCPGTKGFFIALLKNTIFFQRESFGMQDKLQNYRYVANAYRILQSHPSVWKKLVDSVGCWMNAYVCAEGVELYTTLACGSGHSNSGFHLDQYPSDSCKILIYLSDVVKPEDGCTQVLTENGETISLLGNAGTAVFFRASCVLHRGLSPVNDRHCLCIAFGPSMFRSWIRPNPYLNGVYRRFSFLP
jgi:hypothetical protein